MALALRADWSNVRIAKHVGVVESTVREHRDSIVIREPDRRLGVDGKSYPAHNGHAPAAAAEIKLWAERRAGEMLGDMKREGERDRGSGGNRKSRSHDVTVTPSKLSDLGVAKMESSRWQAIASMPEAQFEEHIAEAKKQGKAKRRTWPALAREARQGPRGYGPPAGRLPGPKRGDGPAQVAVVPGKVMVAGHDPIELVRQRGHHRLRFRHHRLRGHLRVQPVADLAE